MTHLPFRYTPEQQQTLEENDRFIPASFLADGDLLILEDAGPMGGRYEGAHIATHYPWILTREGQVQGISRHYQNFHDLTVPPPDRHPLEPGPDLESPDRLLIALDAAAVYLADTYNIHLTTRTLRNWCGSGRLVCRKLSDKSGSPWYTTSRALDQVAEGWIEVKDYGSLPSDDPRFEEADDGLQ